MPMANGSWFDGTGFRKQDVYVVGERLSFSTPRPVDKTIDLSGKFVISPLAEAHTHNIGVLPTAAEMEPYINGGIFYVMSQGQTYPSRAPAMKAPPVEVVNAVATVTPSGSHITELDGRSIERGNFPGLTKADMDGKLHFLVDQPQDLAKLQRPLASRRPALLKIIMGFSEEYAKRKSNPHYLGKRGIDPALVRPLVAMAKRYGARVSAHIETARDFEIAVEEGVDIIAHLPGWRTSESAGFKDETIDRWLISERVARRAAKRGTIVITTVTAGRTLLDPTRPDYQRTVQLHSRNLATLRRAGVRLAIGSDYYQGNSATEAGLLLSRSLDGQLKGLGALTPLELLRLWTIDTPRAIFPGRKIGRLKPGYEANFLVLDGNPIENPLYLTKISGRYMQGRLVDITPADHPAK